MKKDLALKVILFSVFGIVLLWLAKEILFPANYLGFRFNINGNYGGDNMYMNGNYGVGTGTFSVLLVFLIKFLIVVFVLALVVGLFMAAKNYLFTTQDINAFKGSFTPVEKSRKTCDICGKTLESGWKVCPYCAAEVKEKSDL
ncbi:MAG: hypothetical protein K0S01_562 [Herbinix sp.]|jgi:hypothetical protein|nr:hypothetical protein [Herbinix sp.]